jgi:hypothetical protein
VAVTVRMAVSTGRLDSSRHPTINMPAGRG